MAKQTKEKEIMRFIELTEQIDTLTDERDELREKFIDDCITNGEQDTEKGNVFHITVGKSTVTLTVIVERRFNSNKFKKEHKDLYDAYREENTKNKVTATSER